MDTNIKLIRRINKTIVRKDGTLDSFERQLLKLAGGVFDVTKPLIVSPDSSSIDYFEPNRGKPITMKVNTALKIREKHQIGYAFVGECLDLLKDSVLAFESLSHPTSKVVLLDAFSSEGDPYIAICRMDKIMNMVEVNEITSIYDKRNFVRFMVRSFEANKVFFKNKKTEQYIKSQRLQLPREMVFALSNKYYKTSFTKSQVENDRKFKNYLVSSQDVGSLSKRIEAAEQRKVKGFFRKRDKDERAI